MSLSITPLTPQTASAPAARPAAEPEAPEATEPAVTDAERRALAQRFPEAPALALLLYGPRGTVHTHTPAAVGARLDLRA